LLTTSVSGISRFYGTIAANLSYIDADTEKTPKRAENERYRVEK